jgi:putative hemolysin
VTASQVLAATPQAAVSRYSLLLTTDPDAVRAAQRLRHRVFADELGARLPSGEAASTSTGSTPSATT